MNRNILLAVCCIVALNLHVQIVIDEEPNGLKAGFKGQVQNKIVLPVPEMQQIVVQH